MEQDYQKSIYVVWGPSVHPAQMVVHQELGKAREEARRFAAANPNIEFFVLRAVESVQYQADPYLCKTYCKV